ncbi:hypothetical protein [Sphingopyxis chilensis]
MEAQARHRGLTGVDALVTVARSGPAATLGISEHHAEGEGMAARPTVEVDDAPGSGRITR